MDYEQYLTDLTFEYLEKYFSAKEIEKILADYPLTGRKSIRRMLGEMDYEYFGRVYFSQYLSLPPCEFHHEQFAEMKRIEEQKGGETVITAAPRESAKSTDWNTVYTANNALYAKKHYIVLVSDSSDQAVDDLKQVKSAIEENEHILEDFGKLQSAVMWKSDAILLKNNVLICAKGSGKKIRGIKHKQWRPDLIILDDVENDENVQSPEQRKKLMNWFNKVVMNAGSKYTDVVVIGTILHYDSLLNNLLQKAGYRTKKYKAVIEDNNSPLWHDWQEIYTNKSNPNNIEDAYDFFLANREEMEAGSQVIWPEAKDLYYYKRKLIDLGPAAYNSEYQNEPIDPDTAWIRPQDFQYYENLPNLDECIVKGALDPSMGKNGNSDLSAICTVAKDYNGYLYVVESDARRRSPDDQILDIFKKQARFNYIEFYIEAVAFQAYFAGNVQKESAKNGTYLNIVTEPVPKGDKHSRIKAQLQPLIVNGYIKFHKSQQSLIEGLIYLGSLKYDDEPESLQMVSALFTQTNTEFQHALLPGIRGVSSKW